MQKYQKIILVVSLVLIGIVLIVGGYNAGFYFTSNINALGDSFEVNHDCEDCGKTVTIECVDVEDGLLD